MGRHQEERENRQFTRSEVPVLARLADDRFNFQPVVDISRAGLRMKSQLSVERDQWVPVRLFFPDLTEEVEIVGRVVWTKRSGEFGLDYRGLDDDDSGLLDVLISHQHHLHQTLN